MRRSSWLTTIDQLPRARVESLNNYSIVGGSIVNVRLGEHSLRWRVTRAEVDILLSGRAVKLLLALPRAHSFQVVARTSAIQGWQLDSDPTGLWLTLPRAELQALADSLPTKEPIEHSLDVDGHELKLSFEVDVRDKKNANRSGK